MYYANLVLANTVVRLFSKYKCIPLNVENVKNHQDVPLVVPSRMTMLPDIKIRIVAKGELNSQQSHNECCSAPSPCLFPLVI